LAARLPVVIFYEIVQAGPEIVYNSVISDAPDTLL